MSQQEPQSPVPLLELKQVEAYYEGLIRAISDVSLSVEQGQIVCLLGANGAGKSTTLKVISGLLGAQRGAVTAGKAWLAGRSILDLPTQNLVQQGVVQVIEGRRCFQQLNVEDNLIAGTLNEHGLFALSSRELVQQKLAQVYTWIPALERHRRHLAGLLSGGQQQMLAIARALMVNPKLLLLDEPSMGLAPMMVDEVFELISTLNREQGLSVLVAEQNARVALRYSHHGYVLQAGVVAASGTAAELLQRDDVQEFYLGLGHRQRREALVNSVSP